MDESKPEIILPSGDAKLIESDGVTDRTKERLEEDRAYVPVIIKRNDEAGRHPDDTLSKAIHEGLSQHNRPVQSLLLSAVAAGLILGFAAMSVAVVAEILSGQDSDLLKRLGMAFVYPLGFIVCIMSGTQLFTEQTAMALYSVLDKRAGVNSLLKLWIVVLLGNLLGTFFSSGLIVAAQEVIGAKQGFVEVAEHLIHFSWFQIFISSILAGWLMAQGGWLVLGSSRGISQILNIYIVTFIIGLGGLHHSIAGSAEMFCGFFFSPTIGFYELGLFLSASILGNLLGGSVFVGLLNYGHIRKLST